MDLLICPKCGAKVNEGDDFCENCGEKQSRIIPSRQTVSPGPSREPSPQPPGPAKGFPRMAIVAAAIVVVIGVIIAAVYLMPKTTQDTIVGSWFAGDEPYFAHLVLYPNGTGTYMSDHNGPEKITWTGTEPNVYRVTDANGESFEFIYDQTRDVLNNPRDPTQFVFDHRIFFSSPDPMIGTWKTTNSKGETVYSLIDPDGNGITWNPSARNVSPGRFIVKKINPGHYTFISDSGEHAFTYDSSRDVWFAVEYPDIVRTRTANVYPPEGEWRS